MSLVEKIEVVLDNVRLATGSFYIEDENDLVNTSTNETKKIDYSKVIFKEKINENISSELNILVAVSL